MPPGLAPAAAPAFGKRVTVIVCLLSHLFLCSILKRFREYLPQREMKIKDVSRAKSVGESSIWYCKLTKSYSNCFLEPAVAFP